MFVYLFYFIIFIITITNICTRDELIFRPNQLVRRQKKELAEQVELLLLKGAKIEGLGGKKELETLTSGPVMTPLHFACLSRSYSVIEMLLHYGANVEVR